MVSEIVSIVMATYNGEKYIRQQLDSILEQTYSNFEVIVVDDASTDETLAILYEYSTLDSRIMVHHNEFNCGVVANFERGVRLAKGEFIAFSDQDDVFRKDKIAILVKTFSTNQKCDMVVSDLSLIDGKGSVIAESMWKNQRLAPLSGHPFIRLLYKNFATGCAMMIRRRLLDMALPFPQNCLVHDWWLAIVASGENAGGICLVNQSLTSYRQHGNNVIGAVGKDYTTRLTLRKIVARIFEEQRVRIFYETTKFDSRKQINRLTDYLLCNFWSKGDRLLIENMLNYHHRLIVLEQSSNYVKILCALQRMKFARMTGRTLRETAEIIYFTVFPFK